MKKRTKILATVGPASDSLEMLVSLINAGVNLFRLNFSHGTHEYHGLVLARIREAMEITGMVVGVLQDISGPKIRIGELESKFDLKEGDRILFSKEELVGKRQEEGHYIVSINYPEVLSQLHMGGVYLSL